MPHHSARFQTGSILSCRISSNFEARAETPADTHLWLASCCQLPIVPQRYRCALWLKNSHFSSANWRSTRSVGMPIWIDFWGWAVCRWIGGLRCWCAQKGCIIRFVGWRSIWGRSDRLYRCICCFFVPFRDWAQALERLSSNYPWLLRAESAGMLILPLWLVLFPATPWGMWFTHSYQVNVRMRWREWENSRFMVGCWVASAQPNLFWTIIQTLEFPGVPPAIYQNQTISHTTSAIRELYSQPHCCGRSSLLISV